MTSSGRAAMNGRARSETDAMGPIEKTGQGGTTAVDFDRYRLRRFVESLGSDELETRLEATELGDIATALESNSRAVLFRAAGPEAQELVGNVNGSRSRLARAFGVAPAQLAAEIQRRLRRKPEIVEVSRADARVQQVVLTGQDADLTALPVHLQHGFDGGPYVSASIDYVIDPRSGWTNVGIRRLMLRGRRETGVEPGVAE